MKKLLKNRGAAKITVFEVYRETIRIPFWRVSKCLSGEKEPVVVKQQRQGRLLLGTSFQKRSSKR